MFSHLFVHILSIVFLLNGFYLGTYRINLILKFNLLVLKHYMDRCFVISLPSVLTIIFLLQSMVVNLLEGQSRFCGGYLSSSADGSRFRGARDSSSPFCFTEINMHVCVCTHIYVVFFIWLRWFWLLSARRFDIRDNNTNKSGYKNLQYLYINL